MDNSKEEKEVKRCAECSKQENCSGCSSQQEDCEECATKGSCGGGGCGGCCSALGQRGKLQAYNWLEDIPGGFNDFDMVEVQFKNTRKNFYRNTNNLELQIGDIVAVESSPGHDIGKVSMVGRLVAIQMKKANLRPDVEILRVFRKAKPNDLERYEAAKARENDTMIRSRKIAEDLHLNMKIGDVEYQGDGNKAIFYYIADERVDFRQLIKILADTFKIRVEMKQIGARQEAGRIGGIGPCGRPLCCSGWMSNFVSVSTNAARYQDISLNPQKLAGQCAKLKCCLNFEVDSYVESVKTMPPRDLQLFTQDSIYYQFKSDILKREVIYSTDRNVPANLVTLDVERIYEVMALNRKGIKPASLHAEDKAPKVEKKEFGDIIGQDSLTRFDKVKKKNRNRSNNSPREDNRQNPQRGQQPQERQERPERLDRQPQQDNERQHPANPNARPQRPRNDNNRRNFQRGNNGRDRGDQQQRKQNNNENGNGQNQKNNTPQQ